MASGPFTIFQRARATGLTIDQVQCYLASCCNRLDAAGGRADDMGFYDDHVERLLFVEGLLFIRRAPASGLTQDDIAELVNPLGLRTCGDVVAVVERRLDAMRAAGSAGTQEATRLTEPSKGCSRTGARNDCQILKALSNADH